MVLRIVFLGILSLVSLPLSLQTSVQEGAFEKNDVVTILLLLTTGVSPVTALTSKTTSYRAAKRDPIATGPAPTVIKNLSPSPATSSPPSTTPSLAIPTKTGLKNCNVQGIASDYLSSNLLGTRHAADILTCQLECMYRSRCEAYSFHKPTDGVANCQFYTPLIDGESKVILSKNSCIFFSDKYPSDGSNFCYGSTTL